MARSKSTPGSKTTTNPSKEQTSGGTPANVPDVSERNLSANLIANVQTNAKAECAAEGMETTAPVGIQTGSQDRYRTAEEVGSRKDGFPSSDPNQPGRRDSAPRL